MSDAASIPPSSVNPEPPAAAPQAVVRRARVWFRVLLSLLVLWFGVLGALWYTTVYRVRPAQVAPESAPAITGESAVTSEGTTIIIPATTPPATTAPAAR